MNIKHIVNEISLSKPELTINSIYHLIIPHTYGRILKANLS